MSLQNLTKPTWNEIDKILDTVALRNRTEAWHKFKALAAEVLKGTCNIALPVDEGIRYAVVCRKCRGPICIGESYVFKDVTAEFEHYDCHHKTDREEAKA